MSTELIYPQSEVANDIGNPIPVVIVGGSSGGGGTTINLPPVSVSLPSQTLDAFERQRVSQLFTLGDYKHSYTTNPNFNNIVQSGGAVSFNQNRASASLTTSSDLNSLAVHQTKIYHPYQPGKSQLILSSVNFGYAQQNITKRTGYYDDRDGIYFEQVGSNTSNGSDNGVLNFVIRSYVSGSASEATVGSYKRRVPQSEWNVDKCDGSGPSGFNLDTSKTQLIWIDFQWLGVGRVRCGFVHDGLLIIAHEYYHSNILSEVYISNPNLPVRCEIRNTGATSGGSMEQICCTVMSEGGYSETGIDFEYMMSSSRSINGGAELPLLCIKLANTFNSYPNRINLKLNNMSIFSSGESIAYRIVKLPSDTSLSGTLNWTSVSNDSGALYSVGATSHVEANVTSLAGGFISAGSSQNSISQTLLASISDSKKSLLVQNYDSSSSEVYAILCKNIGNNTAAVRASIQWREIY